MRTELLLPQNQTVCIRVREVQVCCNRWLKRERWLSSFCRTGAFFSGSLFFYRILESKIWAPPDRLICPLRTRLRSGRNAADTYGCKIRSLSAGVTLRSLMDISIDPSPRNQQFSKIRQRKRAPGKPVQTGGCFSTTGKQTHFQEKIVLC